MAAEGVFESGETISAWQTREGALDGHSSAIGVRLFGGEV